MANLDSRVMVGRIHVGDHYTLLLTQYISCGPQDFRQKDFYKVLPIISLWKIMTPGVWPIKTSGTGLAGFM